MIIELNQIMLAKSFDDEKNMNALTFYNEQFSLRLNMTSAAAEILAQLIANTNTSENIVAGTTLEIDMLPPISISSIEHFSLGENSISKNIERDLDIFNKKYIGYSGELHISEVSCDKLTDRKQFCLLSNEAMPISAAHALEIQQRSEYVHYVRQVESAPESLQLLPQ